MDVQDARARRLAQLVEEHEPLPECLPHVAPATLGRYLLIQRATGDGDAIWFTLCDTLQDAVAYWGLNLDPYDWLLRAIVDLDTGIEVPFFVGLSFAPIVPDYGPVKP